MDVTTFGEIDGAAVHEVTLRNAAGAEARVITWGAVLRDLKVPSPRGGLQRVVLGLNSIEDYRNHSPHFGATAGRFANRIAGGRFTLDGRGYQLPLNEAGRTCLHGGPNGFGVRPWRLAVADRQSVTLTLHSPDGDAGFPGALDAACTYRLRDPAILSVEMTARAEAPTIVNLAHHSYFNLDGSPDIFDHEVSIKAALRTVTDAFLIPTGEIVSVAGTPYDFRAARPIRNTAGVTYDGNWVVEALPDPVTGLALAATAHSPQSGLTLEVHSDQPGLQFYDAAKLDCPVPGLDGVPYGPHAGFCFEAQLFPDAPNHRHFPSSVIRPGKIYRQFTDYRFG